MNGLTATIRNPDRWLGWARSLEARRRVIRRKNRPAMELLLRARPVTIRLSYHHFAPSFRWAADLTVRWMNGPSQVLLRKQPSSGVGNRPAVAQRRTASELPVSDRTLRVETAGRKLATLFENISNRTRRLEVGVGRTETVIVARAASEIKDSPTTSHTLQHGPPATEIRSSWTQSKPNGLDVSAINVERITENVMRQLDHRVTAWRERMGRS